ncbi:MAG TPA: FG-GAP repeat protein, partial [Pyrinomonadaceae bacterium]
VAGGAPHVKAFDALTGNTLHSFLAFDPGFAGGVRVATADVNGDGFYDLIVGAGPGAGPHVRVFDARNNLNPLHDFFAYSPNFLGGVYVGGSSAPRAR